jgi:hypothetical protein
VRQPGPPGGDVPGHHQICHAGQRRRGAHQEIDPLARTRARRGIQVEDRVGQRADDPHRLVGDQVSHRREQPLPRLVDDRAAPARSGQLLADEGERRVVGGVRHLALAAARDRRRSGHHAVRRPAQEREQRAAVEIRPPPARLGELLVERLAVGAQERPERRAHPLPTHGAHCVLSQRR